MSNENSKLDAERAAFMQQYPAAKSLGWNGGEFVPARQSQWQINACEQLNPLWQCWKRARASLPVGVPDAEPVLIQAVAVTRDDEEEGLRLEWLLEGGIAEMEFAGQVLFAMPEANSLCDKDGSAHVYIAPPAAPTVKANNAQPEVAENTGSHAMANQLQCQGLAVSAEVDGAATPSEASDADDRKCEAPNCGCADAFCKAWPDQDDAAPTVKAEQGERQAQLKGDQP